MYERLGHHDNAAAAYTDFVDDEFRNADRIECSHAFKFSIQYHLDCNALDEANHYAQKCLQYDDTKEKARAILQTTAQKRLKVDENPTMDEDINQLISLDF